MTDLTPKQWRAALAKYGMTEHGDVSGFGSYVDVGEVAASAPRRAGSFAEHVDAEQRAEILRVVVLAVSACRAGAES